MRDLLLLMTSFGLGFRPHPRETVRKRFAQDVRHRFVGEPTGFGERSELRDPNSCRIHPQSGGVQIG